jgi:microcystin-dependent protein
MDPFVGEIRVFPFSFAPTGWALCNGQLLSISQNTALFSLLGTYYGGDGKATFALPNLQGSVPLGVGQGAGLSAYDLGGAGGAQSVTLLASEMPMHTHVLRGSSDPATVRRPGSDRALAASTDGAVYADAGAGSPTPMSPQEVATAGGDQPHNNMQPTLMFNFCIALRGVFPPRP